MHYTMKLDKLLVEKAKFDLVKDIVLSIIDRYGEIETITLPYFAKPYLSLINIGIDTDGRHTYLNIPVYFHDDEDIKVLLRS